MFHQYLLQQRFPTTSKKPVETPIKTFEQPLAVQTQKKKKEAIVNDAGLEGEIKDDKGKFPHQKKRRVKSDYFTFKV